MACTGLEGPDVLARYVEASHSSAAVGLGSIGPKIAPFASHCSLSISLAPQEGVKGPLPRNTTEVRLCIVQQIKRENILVKHQH